MHRAIFAGLGLVTSDYATADSATKMMKEMQEYKEETFGCGGEESIVKCDEIPEVEIEMRFQQDPQVSFVVKAVSALTAAFRLVQLDHCTDDVRARCLRKIRGEELHDDIMAGREPRPPKDWTPRTPHGGGGSGGAPAVTTDPATTVA